MVKIILYGPEDGKNRCIEEAKKFDFLLEAESAPALEALSEYVDLKALPSVSLRIHRENANLTQKELADRVGIKQHHISEMENNKRPIGKELARKIAQALNTDYRSYL